MSLQREPLPSLIFHLSSWHDKFPDWKAGSERNAINVSQLTH
ncbi:hypothetical protein ECH7EC4501_1546 [Escherichia coli O157:H7 str. EC4501]|nr:hypothetical protein ECH7EC4501_1546 [Escherichia coli O157:H7 str. EC4501]